MKPKYRSGLRPYIKDFCNCTHVVTDYKYIGVREREGIDGEENVYEYMCTSCKERKIYSIKTLKEILEADK